MLGGEQFAGGGPLISYDPEHADWENYPLTVDELLNAIVSKDGSLYFGSLGKGLVRYNGDFAWWSVPNVPQRSRFTRILPAPDGTLWWQDDYHLPIDTFNPSTETWGKAFENDLCSF